MDIMTFIAEDEHFGRDELKHQLSVYSEVKLVGESDNGLDALKTIKELRPDLIFLDIEMPGLKGTDVLDHIASMESYKPFIIIVTAYDNYAVKAFEHDVVDYLLKPIDSSRFAKAMARVLKYFGAIKRINRISAKKGSKIVLLAMEDISCIYMDNSTIYLASKDLVYSTTYRTLDEIQKELDEKDFFRAHRAYIVNLKNLRELKQADSGTMLIRLEGFEKDVPVSRTRAKELKSFFKL
jgi:DNA-binding LytR/AlgR family response regulator